MNQISGYVGNAEIGKTSYVSTNIPEWTGRQCYSAVHLARLQLAPTDAPLAMMPRLAVVQDPSQRYSVSFSEEKKILEKLKDMKEKRDAEEKQREDRK